MFSSGPSAAPQLSIHEEVRTEIEIVGKDACWCREAGIQRDRSRETSAQDRATSTRPAISLWITIIIIYMDKHGILVRIRIPHECYGAAS